MAKYVFDSSAFIRLYKIFPRRNTFDALWKKYDILINNQEIISSSEAYREITGRDNIVKEGVKNYKHIFLKPTDKEISLVPVILAKHPFLIKMKNINNGNPVADPFLIAMAKERNLTLVTDEKQSLNAHKIPNICIEYGIVCVDLFDFFDKENLKLVESSK